MIKKPPLLKSKLPLLLLLLFSCLTGVSSLYAQKTQLQGQVLDSLAEGIPNTNLIATSCQKRSKIIFPQLI